MKKPRRLVAYYVAGVAVLPLLAAALCAALFAGHGSSVVARDGEGAVVARAPLADSGRFGIGYVHSYYGTPATERFVADRDGSFRLVGVSSPDEAVLDYYGLEGRKEATGDVLRLVPAVPQRFETLPLVATATGRRALVVSGERIPLYGEDGPVHLSIRVEEDTPLARVRRALGEGG